MKSIQKAKYHTEKIRCLRCPIGSYPQLNHLPPVIPIISLKTPPTYSKSIIGQFGCVGGVGLSRKYQT